MCIFISSLQETSTHLMGVQNSTIPVEQKLAVSTKIVDAFRPLTKHWHF